VWRVGVKARAARFYPSTAAHPTPSRRLTALAPDNASWKNQRDWFEKRVTALTQPPAQ